MPPTGSDAVPRDREPTGPARRTDDPLHDPGAVLRGAVRRVWRAALDGRDVGIDGCRSVVQGDQHRHGRRALRILRVDTDGPFEVAARRYRIAGYGDGRKNASAVRGGDGENAPSRAWLDAQLHQRADRSDAALRAGLYRR